MKSKVYSGLAVILGMTVNAQAAGFRIGEQDARANAMMPVHRNSDTARYRLPYLPVSG